jgi:MEDS: MEthanogen/methylotroph, DcmR Sensory domain
MDPADDNVKVSGKDTNESARRICLAGSALGDRCHVCAFFKSRDEEYRVLLPFVREGRERGEKIVHTIDPERRGEHLQRLAAGGIDVATLLQDGRFELRTWSDTHLLDGYFDQYRTLKLFEGVVKNAKQQGFPLTRFVTHMEWALKNEKQITDLLEYEARANEVWERQEGPINPVICTYDLTKFTGDVVVDVMRTHPMIIVGGILQENPFYVPPKKFLQELRERLGPKQMPP